MLNDLTWILFTTQLRNMQPIGAVFNLWWLHMFFVFFMPSLTEQPVAAALTVHCSHLWQKNRKWHLTPFSHSAIFSRCGCLEPVVWLSQTQDSAVAFFVALTHCLSTQMENPVVLCRRRRVYWSHCGEMWGVALLLLIVQPNSKPTKHSLYNLYWYIVATSASGLPANCRWFLCLMFEMRSSLLWPRGMQVLSHTLCICYLDGCW